MFEALKKAPTTDMENALRWYNHIASFNDAEKQKYVDSTDVVHTRVPLCLDFKVTRQALEQYGRQKGQDSQEKQEFKSLSVNPADKAAAAAADDDDVDLFGDEDEEASEQTKQRLAAYAAKKSTSKPFHRLSHDSHGPFLLEPVLIAKSNIVLDVSLILLIEWRDIAFSTRRRSSHGTMKPT